MSTPWARYLSAEDAAVLARGRFGRRMGFGARPAVLVIDAQRFMVGVEGEDAHWPSSCGATGRQAIAHVARLVAAAQRAGVVCFFTRFELARDRSDVGVYARKRDFLDDEHWCLAGSLGAELVPQLTPGANDVVIVKKKPSAFHGTPLLGQLIDRAIDTLIVVGGATSNCVHATVFDAASYNFRTIVVQEAVFDRIPVSHAIALFDMDRQFADVVALTEVLDYVQASGARSAARA